jgi:CRISPR type III-B/RAMP module RAMP protein Cmr6
MKIIAHRNEVHTAATMSAAGSPGHRFLRLPAELAADSDDGQTARESVISMLAHKVSSGDLAFYRGALARRRKCLSSAGAHIRSFTTLAPMLPGFGNKGVHEFGFHFIEPWGLPYLPGSTMKGIAAAFAQRMGAEGWQRGGKPGQPGGALHAGLFGGRWREAEQVHEIIGAVQFHDAWWEPSSGLPASPFRELGGTGEAIGRDIVTTHYRDYYIGESPRAPDGTENPVPVTFLHIPAGHKFCCALSGHPDWVSLAWGILEGALKAGVGAKTRLGYGRCKLLSAPLEDHPRPPHPLPLPPQTQEPVVHPLVACVLTGKSAGGSWKASFKSGTPLQCGIVTVGSERLPQDTAVGKELDLLVIDSKTGRQYKFAVP